MIIIHFFGALAKVVWNSDLGLRLGLEIASGLGLTLELLLRLGIGSGLQLARLALEFRRGSFAIALHPFFHSKLKNQSLLVSQIF